MKLYICEKPSLAKALAGNLGNPVSGKNCYEVGGDCVAWLKGHILEAQMPDDYKDEWKRSNCTYDKLPMIPEKFVKTVKKGDYFAIYKGISDLAKKADVIVNVGDPDREGQYLVDEVIEKLGWKGPVERLFINAYDDVTIKKALDSIEDNKSAKNYNMFRSAFCRDFTDWLIGMNGSRKFSLDAKRNIVVGRVQVPILALVYRRNKEIDNFVPVDYFKVKANMAGDTDSFAADWKPTEAEAEGGFDRENRLIVKDIAEKAVGCFTGKQAVISDIVKEHKKIPQLLPFSLATLQKKACGKLGISLKELDEAMQSLYEKHKLLTYPRSDCEFIPESQFGDAEKIIGMLKGLGDKNLEAVADGADSSIRSRAFNTAKTTAHHAIIPTGTEADFSVLSDTEKGVYLIVAERYLMQFYPVYEYDVTKIILDCDGSRFEAAGTVVAVPGWKKIAEADESDDKDAEKAKPLPDCHKGDSFHVESCAVVTATTKPPKRFTQESLIEALCNAYKYVHDPKYKEVIKDVKGLGTPATRSKIIEKLLVKGSLYEKGKGKKKELFTADDVPELIDSLPDELTYPDQTGIIELDLDKVASGEMTESDYRKKIAGYINMLMQIEGKFVIRARVSKDHPLCPACGKGVLWKHDGKNGVFWSCSRYKEGCEMVFSDVKGKPYTEKCPECGEGFLTKRSGRYGDFWGCTRYKEGCKAMFDDVNGKPGIFKCPVCKKHYLKRKQNRQKGNYFWSCAGYAAGECKASFPDKDGKPDFTEKKPLSGKTEKCPSCGKNMKQVNTRNGIFWVCEDNKKGCHAPWFEDVNGKPRIIECPECSGFLVKRHGVKGDFYSCSNYPNCRVSFNCDDKGKPVFPNKKK